jgi:hypothetical protein
MKKISSVIIFLICAGIGIQNSALAAQQKSAKVEKERLVLMPLRVPEEDASLLGAMETALVQGLQQKYEVLYGERVAKKAKEIFDKESHSTARKECDETRCMQGIAEAFQAELLATTNVTKRIDGYILALSIQNIFDNKVVFSNSTPCKNCDAYQVIEKLKELSGFSVQASHQGKIVEPTTAVNASNAETELWGAVSKGNSIEEYTVYLKQYPQGKYKDLAEIRLNKLQNENAADAAEAERQEKIFWDVANKYPKVSNFENYVNKFPKGKHIDLAKIRIKELIAEQGEREEADIWDKAKNNDEVQLQHYIRRYPSGRHLTEAQIKLKEMEKQKHNPEFTDPKTGLIWRRCAEGMVFNSGICSGTGSKFTYDAALQLAAEQAKSTGIAWRVPQKDELFSIVDNNFSPRINRDVFPYTPASEFWTSSAIEKSNPSSKCTAWSVIFFNGRVSQDLCSYRYYVRLVRSVR